MSTNWITMTDTMNGHEEDMEIVEEKKPGTVKRLSKVTFKVGPIHQEDLAAPELNRLISLAERFSISFDTVTILDSEQTDRLGYVTLPFEIRTKTFLVHIYDKLSKLRVGNRDMSIKMPEEFTRHVDEVRAQLEEQKQKRRELAQQKADQRKKCLFASFVDKDSGELSLREKFPDATDVSLTEYKEQWYGTMEFESAEKANEIFKATKEVEIDSNKVKINRTPPDEIDKPRPSPQQNRPKQAFNRGGGGSNRGGRGGYNQPRPLLAGGGGGMGGGMNYAQQQRMGGFSSMGGARYDNYGSGDYQGGYGRMQGGYGASGGGGWQLGAKRKGDIGGDFDRNPKKPYGGGGRGGFGGGRGGWGGGGGFPNYW